MHLKRMELQGFKSFADKTVLEFMPGITTVIGPNGSGKSNISDAIRWVLGEQSIKSLRGSKSEDIIFAGTQNRKSLGFAEASIIIDNSDGKLPIEYEEVTVTRKIYRSGETGYYINKTPCRLKDILELFMDTGIGKDGYSIIGQGKIDEILSNKSEDRRHIFEEAAGIVKYRVRKSESEKKLEQTKLNLLRVSDILSEIESNIEPLKVQSEKAKKYLDLREQLKQIEIGLFAYNIENLKQKLTQISEDEKVLNDNTNIEQSKLDELQQLKESLRQEIDNLITEIEKMQNIGFESTNKIEKINSSISVSKERITNNEQNSVRFDEEIQSITLKIAELEEEKKTKLEKKENLYTDKQKFKTELEKKQEELNKLTEKLSEEEIKIEEKKAKVEENTNQKYEIISNIQLKTANYENILKREKTLQEDVRVSISELDSLRMSREDIAKSFYEIENKKVNITKTLEEINLKKEESINNINKYETQINALLSESRIKEARLKFLKETEKEKEGYAKSVKSLLLDCEKDSNLNKGMHGTLANLLSVPKEYETAIQMCLAGSLQNIVTDTEQDAKKLVEHLKKNNLGRASFLPISTVKGKKIDRLIKNNLDGVIGVASDLVKSDKKYEQIVLNLLGKTVIVDNMDTAIILAKQNNYTFRIVTLLGDVINPSGLITGGSVQAKTVNILGRTREIEELEKYLKQTNQKIEELTKKKKEYEQSVEGTLEEAIALEKSYQEIDITFATEKQKIVSIEENIVKAEEKLEKAKQEQEKLKLEKEQLLTDKQKEEEIEQELEKQIQELTNQIQEYTLLNKDNQKYLDDLNFDITNLKISVSSFDESETSIDELVERIEQDVENNKNSIENKKKQKENIKEENEKLKQEIVELESQIEQIKQEVQTSGTKIEELKQLRADKNEELNVKEKDILEKIKTIEDLKGQLIKTEVKKTKLEQDIDQTINQMWEEYEVTPNNINEYKRPDNIQQTTKQVKDLKNEIKELGSINIDSIEEYKKTKERYDFMCEQRVDLEDSIAKLKKVIQDITTVMKEQFKEQFEVINKNFNEVFKELFSGGKAELILTDEENILECGIDIAVQPPGKKLQNMMLLSGGEKAFTAIALLFAILKINPAPICVLDEIEAALDEVNVYRFADYLKKFTKYTQFLVITHRKGTMEAADSVYGITMEENGISKLLSMKLK